MPAAPVASVRMSYNPIEGAVEIIPDRLYYAALKSQPRPDHTHPTVSCSGDVEHKPIHFFSIDTELVYWNFFLDFGPLNLGQLYRFCSKLNDKLRSKALKEQVICFCSNTMPAKQANAMFLICAWQMLFLDRTPEEAYRGFRRKDPEGRLDTIPTSPNRKNAASSPPMRTTGNPTVCAVPPFHDASPCPCTFDLTILDCLRGLAKARMYGFFDFTTFDVEEYEYYEQVENGDLNWIMKDRILAFAGPHYRRNVSKEGYCTLTPSDYIPYFTKKQVALVVRLNKKCYEEKDFTKVGIAHLEQYYLDGSCPPMKILNRVLQAFESVPSHQAIAVHCKAGLGRTGTCIGAYMMKHYKFTAAEAIAWMRICRPGCVIGPQQHFLQDIEQRMWHEGNIMTLNPRQGGSLLRVTTSSSSTSTAASDDPEVNVTNAKFRKVKSQRQSMVPLHFGTLSVQERRVQPEHISEAVIGRAGQAESLLARRQASHPQSLV